MKSRTAKDVRNFGAWRACTACSNAYAYLISLGSLQARPMKDTPIGQLARVTGGDGDVGKPATAAGEESEFKK